MTPARPATFLDRIRTWWRPPRRLQFTREGKYFVGITIGVGFAAINTGNNLLYLLLGMMLSLIIVAVNFMVDLLYLYLNPQVRIS